MSETFVPCELEVACANKYVPVPNNNSSGKRQFVSVLTG